MKTTRIIALALALFIGAMSVFAGSMVLLGFRIPDYTVLNWLVIYNVLLGVLSIVTAFLIWKNYWLSKKLIGTILTSHLLMLLYLYFVSDVVAMDSIKAMGFRVSIWFVIFILTYKNSIK